MGRVTRKPFRSAVFLAAEGPGRTISKHAAKQIFFSQGGPADAVFYLQTGRAKLAVLSKSGKEATVTLLSAGDFFGEESIAGAGTRRTVTASAITDCTVLKIATAEILRVLQKEHDFSTFFLKFIVIRGMRTQADLIDQLFNSSERRLARALLLMAEYGEPGAPETLIPPVTQGTLAAIIGTTRSRVSFFMNRFRKLGYIHYNGGIRVHRSLLKVVLRDQLPEQNASRPKLLDPHPVQHEPPNERSSCEQRVTRIELHVDRARRRKNALVWLNVRVVGDPDVSNRDRAADTSGMPGIRSLKQRSS